MNTKLAFGVSNAQGRPGERGREDDSWAGGFSPRAGIARVFLRKDEEAGRVLGAAPLFSSAASLDGEPETLVRRKQDGF